MATKTIESATPHSLKVLTITDLDGKVVGLDIQNEDDELTINVSREDLLDALGLGQGFIDKLNEVEFLLSRALNTPGVPGDVYSDTALAHEDLLSAIGTVLS